MDFNKERQNGVENVRTLGGFKPEVHREKEGCVYIYSGKNLTDVGERNGDVNLCKIGIPGGGEIDLLSILSPSHKPMDGLAVYVSDNGETIRWAKSDGVSEIGEYPNDSALMADWLVRKVYDDNLLDNAEDAVDSVENGMTSIGKKGAATIEYGEIKKGEYKWNIRMFRIGSTRALKRGLVATGSAGVSEAYHISRRDDDYNEPWFPNQKKRFVGYRSVGERKTADPSSDEEFDINTATDGLNSLVGSMYRNTGRLTDRTLIEAVGKGNLLEGVRRLREDGYMSTSDDVSMISIHLPKRSGR